MSLTSIFDSIPRVWKAIVIIFIATSAGVTFGGATVQYTAIPKALDALEIRHAEDIKRLTRVIEDAQQDNEKTNEKLDRLICMQMAEYRNADPLSCI